MSTEKTRPNYALGYTSAEERRLIHQAGLLVPHTEQVFRAAGVAPGNRVLDLGSGIGDVSLLLARLVGPEGEVIGIERNARSVERARSRTADAGLTNVSFVNSDLAQFAVAGEFDAVVGRFILMYLPEPVAILRRVKKMLRRGGALAFIEPSWAASRGLLAHLPVYSAAAGAVVEAFRACGVNTEMGLALHGVFLTAGLPAPQMNIDMMLGAGNEVTEAMCDIVRSLEPQARNNGVSLENAGDVTTLAARLQAEIDSTGHPIVWLAGHVGAWARLP